MSQLFLAVLALFAVTGTQAVDGKLTAQQQRMKDCNAQANRQRLMSEARQHFMANCMRSHGDGPPRFTAQQSRMSACNRLAGERELPAGARQDFVQDCLKGETAAAGGRR